MKGGQGGRWSGGEGGNREGERSVWGRAGSHVQRTTQFAADSLPEIKMKKLSVSGRFRLSTLNLKVPNTSKI